MNYLDELKKRVAEAFKDATEKSAIDNMANINAAIDCVSKEQDQLMAKNKELIAAYRDAVSHPGVSLQKDETMDPTNVPEPQKMPDFADFVAHNMPKYKGEN